MASFVRVLFVVLGVTVALVGLFNGYVVRELSEYEIERHRSLEGAPPDDEQEPEVPVVKVVQGRRGEEPADERRQLNILTLGGSVTWGAEISNRHLAYPFLLQDQDGHNVTNLAIRATGSDYPAQCISSMLREEEEREGTTYDPNIPFDVIVFDFSINGMDGFELLLKRLQIRFPEALIIYIDLWSLRHGGNMDSKEARNLVKDAGGYVYFMGNKAMPDEEFDYRELLKTPEEEEVLELFAGDQHHLSPYGHKLVRHQIRNIIQWFGKIPNDPALGSWLGGDRCTTWYGDGAVPFNIIDGGTMREWDEVKHKWALEVEQRGMVFEYVHDGSNSATLNLQFMTKAPNMRNPLSSWYPSVIVKIANEESAIEQAKACAFTKKHVRPDRELLFFASESQCFDEQGGWTFIDGLQKKLGLRNFHITEIAYAGMLQPGRNLVFVHPVGARNNLFRMTATIVCEACGRLGWTEV